MVEVTVFVFDGETIMLSLEQSNQLTHHSGTDTISTVDISSIDIRSTASELEVAALLGNNVGTSRFTDAGLLILISLAGGPKHGYAMITDIEEIADVKLGPGTLYTALSRLEGQGLIEPVASDDRRKPYQLTPGGRAELSAQLAGMEGLAATGVQRMETA